MPIFNDSNLCEELSKFIDVHWSIQEILFNLITNYLKFSSSSPTVSEHPAVSINSNGITSL